MAFRRQDIPRTVRTVGEGQPRRLYPRYARDGALLPKIALAIRCLDAAVGRRRADVDPDAVLDAFGDPKLARCMVHCLSASYRWRQDAVAEVVGPEAADLLSSAGLGAPAALRGAVYVAANRIAAGAVDDETRTLVLGDVGAPFGLDAADIDRLLHLDAERNARLVRAGADIRPEDVLARYNTMLTLSVLRQASSVDLVAPGVPERAARAVLEREGVSGGLSADGTVRMRGRRGTVGGYGQFGGRVARAALSLALAADGAISGGAVAVLSDERLELPLAGFAAGTLRPALVAASGQGRWALVDDLTESIAAHRRAEPGFGGWTVRRAMEPLVVDGAFALPDLLLVRDGMTVALVAADPESPGAGEALRMVQRAGRAVALGVEVAGVPSLAEPDAAQLLRLLERLASEDVAPAQPLDVVRGELVRVGWVEEGRLDALLGDGTWAAGIPGGEAVPGFGLCRRELVDELRMALARDGMAVGRLRDAIAARVGDGPGADALTLHVLRSATARLEAA